MLSVHTPQETQEGPPAQLLTLYDPNMRAQARCHTCFWSSRLVKPWWRRLLPIGSGVQGFVGLSVGRKVQAVTVDQRK